MHLISLTSSFSCSPPKLKFNSGFSTLEISSVGRLSGTGYIQNWNSKVKSKDTVFHLGDVGVGRPELLRQILDRLNGKICLIKGNHDKTATHKLCVNRFEWIKDYHFAVFNHGIKIALFHYALRVWDRCHYGSWHLYGHSHGRLVPEEGRCCFDVGVNNWDYKPLSLDEIRQEMIKRGWEDNSIRAVKS